MLRAPSLLILDDPFDGLDRAGCAELAQAIVHVAERLPVLVVGTFGARELPFALEALREVVVIAERRVVFRGTPQAFGARGRDQSHAPKAAAGGAGQLVRAARPRRAAGAAPRWSASATASRSSSRSSISRVAAGQHTLIEGPNGSGKSSLLEMITGDHPQAYSNDLHLFGRRRGSGETVWDIKKNVGVVSARLHRDYRVGGSVEEVLLSGLFDSIGVYQKPEPSHRARARAWLAWLELGIAPTAAFRELSFGQQRLVLIARAAIKVPPLVVMDEPTSGLDAENRAPRPRAGRVAVHAAEEHRADGHAPRRRARLLAGTDRRRDPGSQELVKARGVRSRDYVA